MSDPIRFSFLPLGGPTAILEIAGLRLLTDPTFDGPGEYPRGAYNLVKTEGPALGPDQIGRIDAVLLSHDQHPDNLDHAGRIFLAQAPLVLTTIAGAARLGACATPLPQWSHVDLPCPGGGMLRVTSVPAQHGPDGSHHLTGEVTGFVLSGEGLPTVYISGDNASLAVVRAIVGRMGTVEIAVLFAGAARSPLLGDANLTLNGEEAAAAAHLLGARHVVPLHVDGWGHFAEGVDAVRRAFAAAGIAGRLAPVARGTTVIL